MNTVEEQIKTIKFREIGASLGTRNLAATLRDDILKDIDVNDKIVFDFEGVNVISNSFANECFAKMASTISMKVFREKFAFINANDFIQRVIISSF